MQQDPAHPLMKLLSPEAQSERPLAICLALIAGWVDAYGLRAFGTYVSFMSGNTTQTGSMTGQGNLVAALPSALAILFFILGSFAGSWLIHSDWRHSRQILFAGVAALLAVTTGVIQSGVFDTKVAIAMLSLSMGMMNSALSRVGHEQVSLTFMTGTLSRIGSHLALALRGSPLQDAQNPRDTQLRRAGLLASIWAGFLTGAIVSGAFTARFGVWVLVCPLLTLLALALHDWKRLQADERSGAMQHQVSAHGM